MAAQETHPWPADKVERSLVERLYARNCQDTQPGSGRPDRSLDPAIGLDQPGAGR